MTKISYVHGVPMWSARPDEMKDRAAGVRGMGDYLPYTQMTKGEFQLALLRDQAKVFSEMYPEQKKHARAVQMIDNALYKGVHGMSAMVGSIDDTLQDVARQISRASRENQPAAGTFIGRDTLLRGINADTAIIKYTEDDCLRYATKEANRFYNVNWTTQKWVTLNRQLNKAKAQRFDSLVQFCQADKDIEKLLNDKLVDGGHHMLYKNLSPEYPGILGTAVIAKRILHRAGIGGLHNATGVDDTQMSAWVETCILRKNAASNVGALGSVASSMYLAPDAEQSVARYVAWAKDSPGNADEKKAQTRMNASIGIAPLLVALIPVILAAINVASQILAGIQAKRASAMAAANGFGTTAFQAEQSDFAGGKTGDTGGGATSSTGTDMLPLILLGGGALLLLNDD